METEFIKNITRRDLTRGQLKISDYIIKNQKRILGMTAREIGREIGMSDASVIRFCRVAGYEGFDDMKEHIRNELKRNDVGIGSHSLSERFALQSEKYMEGDWEENESIRLMQMNLETSLRQNNQESYHRIADQILKANRKTVIGLRGGKGCATQFARLLGLLTDNVHCIIDEGNDQLSKMIDFDQKDIVVILNFPRYYKIDIQLAEIIRARKIPCILITDSVESPIARAADEILLVETEHCGFFHSMLGVMGVLEYLLILMCRKEPEVFRNRLHERDVILKDYLVN